MKIEEIARLCHEVNKLYCESIGDKSQLPWEEAPQEFRDSSINQVQKVLIDDMSPEDLHESWRQERLDNGWTYGEVKDSDTKTHPCLVDFRKLPEEQIRKDMLFGVVALALGLPVKDVTG